MLLMKAMAKRFMKNVRMNAHHLQDAKEYQPKNLQQQQQQQQHNLHLNQYQHLVQHRIPVSTPGPTPAPVATSGPTPAPVSTPSPSSTAGGLTGTDSSSGALGGTKQQDNSNANMGGSSQNQSQTAAPAADSQSGYSCDNSPDAVMTVTGVGSDPSKILHRECKFISNKPDEREKEFCDATDESNGKKVYEKCQNECPSFTGC